ncbi:Pentatricopeptide repeat-containing protein [Thalictrum thalictroides]|uniref:Pentatricopeptide repeat-containing protein n=1 Tax=Thalictrum thalictroides TaxID=46969 RepID=A0A7J6V886_THATH|nr:Pentatricopeptide repeat-containing protein [Thalictrum thalictroides]
MPIKGIRPNDVTFATLISALCLNGKLDEAFRLREDMVKKYGVKPSIYVNTSLIKVYSTLISGLFKAGRKGEVVGVLEEMGKTGCKPNTVTYNAMIFGYCNEKDFESAFLVLKEIVEKGYKPDVISYNLISALCKGGK